MAFLEHFCYLIQNPVKPCCMGKWRVIGKCIGCTSDDNIEGKDGLQNYNGVVL